MPPDITHLSRSQLEAGTGATRAEILTWREFIKFPLANDAPGKAMKYSAINGIEYALLKTGVSRGVPHQVMADFIYKRLSDAIIRADAHRLALTSSIIDDPAAWLEGSEFDILSKPWFGPTVSYSAAFWSFNPLRNFAGRSLHDDFLRTLRHGQDWEAAKKRLNVQDEYGPITDANEAVKEAVFHAVLAGEIVIEIRKPIRHLYAMTYSTEFIPGDKRVNRGEKREDQD